MKNISFWEKRKLFENIDICVVGAGIVGIHTALFLRKEHPKAKIIVLEKALIGAAASSKNAGFACFGSLSEILSDIDTIGEQAALDLVKMRWDGLQLLEKTHGKNNLGLSMVGGYELFRPSDKELYDSCRTLLKEINAELSYIGHDVYQDLPSTDYPFRQVSHCILNRFEGALETDQMYWSMINLAHQAGIEIIRGFEVENYIQIDKSVEISLLNTDISFKCSNLFITTNGFAKGLLPEVEVEPARAQVMVTAPIPGFKLSGTFHYDCGYYYFRNVGDRLLIGGARNADFISENTTKQEVTADIQAKITELMYEVILDKEIEIDYRWAGTMGIGTSKEPIIKQISTNVFAGVRMGGMGVAIGALVGKKLADLLPKQ